MRTILFLVFAVLLALPAYAANQTPKGLKKKAVDCYCTNRGVRFELGEFACLRVDGRRFLAKCEMSLNNPMWREKEPSCPTS